MRVLSVVLLVLLTFTACGSKTKESLYAEGVKQLKAGNPGAAVVYFKNALEKDGNFNDARFELGKAYATLGKFEQAEKEFLKVLKQNPARDEALLELAKVLNSQGKGAEGYKVGEQYQAKHPQEASGFEVLGVSCAVQKRYEEAEKYLTQALTLAPQRYETKLELAAVAMATGKADRAKTLLEEVTVADPANNKALYMLAGLEKSSGHIDKAVAIYSRIIAAKPTEIAAHYKLGLIEIEKGDLAAADARGDEMIKSFPKKGDGYRLKGLISFYRRNYDEAMTSLQTSIKLSPTPEAYHFLGLCYYNKGELENALSQFRVILDRIPTSRQARLMTAQTLLAQKRTDDAVSEIKKVLAENDGDAAAHNMLGTAYMTQGMFEEGMRELNRATKLDPKMVNAHLKKGYYYFSRGKNQEGETELATAVQAAPDALNGRLLLASYYARQGKGTKAMSVLKAGLTGGKGDAPLYNAIAALELSTGNKAGGIKGLQDAKRVDPLFPASYQNLAGIYASSGDYPHALDELNELLKRDPKNLKALLGVASLTELSGRSDEALQYYSKAVKSGSPEAYLALAGFHNKKGAQDKVIEVLEEAIKQNPRSIELLEAKGIALMTKKDYRKALNTFDQLEILNPEQGLNRKINAYLAMGDGGKALGQAKRMIAKEPSSAKGYVVLASVHQNLKDIPSAIAEAEKGVKVEPKSVEARLMLGSLLQESKEFARAKGVYEDALKLNPDSVAAEFAVAALLDATDRKKEAAARYRAVISRDDTFVPALNNLAYLCADGYGKTDDALRFAIAAFRLRPGDAGVMDTVGYALLKNGRYADAVKVLERAATLLPANPSVSYHLGLAYQLSGNRTKADQALRKCLTLGDSPDTKAASALLAKLNR